MSDPAAPYPSVVALLPMRNLVLFPHVMSPITVGRSKSVAALQQAMAGGLPLGLVLQKNASDDDPGLDALCAVGTLATVVHHVSAQSDQHHAVCRGLQRFRILGPAEGEHPFLCARIEPLEECDERSSESEALAMQLRERTMELLALLPSVPAELVHALQATRGAAELADITASVIDAEVAEK